MSDVVAFPPIKSRRALELVQKLLTERAFSAGHLSILIATGQLEPEQAQRQYAEMVTAFAEDLAEAIKHLAEETCGGRA